MFSEKNFPLIYQWNDRRTGTPYLSGKPPSWYESKFSYENPPCTQVIQRGWLIDDTCESNPMLAEKFRKNAKEYADKKDQELQHAKLIVQLKEEGKIEFGLTK